MSERFFCERCARDFESAEARCPICLRKSSVRARAAASTSEVAQLASGDHSQASAGRQASALVAAIALSALLGALVLLAWSRLVAAGLVVPALVACAVAAGLWIRAALVDSGSDERTWAAFAKRCTLGGVLAVWAFVCGVSALLGARDLSVPFAVVLGIVLFFGGVVPVLRWMQKAEEPNKPASGKWR